MDAIDKLFVPKKKLIKSLKDKFTISLKFDEEKDLEAYKVAQKIKQISDNTGVGSLPEITMILIESGIEQYEQRLSKGTPESIKHKIVSIKKAV